MAAKVEIKTFKNTRNKVKVPFIVSFSLPFMPTEYGFTPSEKVISEGRDYVSISLKLGQVCCFWKISGWKASNSMRGESY